MSRNPRVTLSPRPLRNLLTTYMLRKLVCVGRISQREKSSGYKTMMTISHNDEWKENRLGGSDKVRMGFGFPKKIPSYLFRFLETERGKKEEGGFSAIIVSCVFWLVRRFQVRLNFPWVEGNQNEQNGKHYPITVCKARKSVLMKIQSLSFLSPPEKTITTISLTPDLSFKIESPGESVHLWGKWMLRKTSHEGFFALSILCSTKNWLPYVHHLVYAY